MKLLIHICCGPCMVYPQSVLESEKIEYEGYYFNPNIHPSDEFEKRMQNLQKLAALKDFNVTYINQVDQELWENFEGPEQERCKMCYSIRLENAARFAKENGFDAFTTTLLVSPYQKHHLIKDLGESFAKKYGIAFYYRDFRPGFRAGQAVAKELGLYRQKFCGCVKSKNS